MASQTTRLSQPLQTAANRFAGEHFVHETLILLQAVVDRDLDALLGIGDEDFAIIDVDPEGQTSLARTEPGWEPWFRRYFLMLDALDASIDVEIESYQALKTSELGYSVVEFRQTVEGRSLSAWFDCVATIVWKNTDDGWKEARWHCSILDRGITSGEADSSKGTVRATAMAGG
ncbi:MAG: nuclear transport factor 2 family protein [Acidimicrobiales bacterium]